MITSTEPNLDISVDTRVDDTKHTYYDDKVTDVDVQGNVTHQENLKQQCHTEEVAEEGWVPPDGGYGWVIVGCSFTMFLLFTAYSQLGVFLLELEKSFKVSKTTITWINAAHTVTGRVLGILIGPLLKQVSSRWVAFAGVVLLSAGYFISSHVNSIPLMFLTFGFIPSVGCGCLLTTANVVTQQYFTTKRSLANGFALVGASAGFFVWPAVGQALIQKYGWRTTFKIESSIFLTLGIICIIFLKPARSNIFCQCYKFTESEKDKNNARKSTVSNKGTCLENICDLKLLKNPAITIYYISKWLMSIGYLINSVYMPVRGEMMGFSPSSSAWQASINGICDGISTTIFAIVATVPGVNRMLMSIVGMVLNGIQCFGSTFLRSSTLLLVNAGVFGAISGTYGSVMFVTIVDMVGTEHVEVAGGFFSTTLGLGHLVLHPISGALLDGTGDPQGPFYFASGALLLAAATEGVALYLWTRQHGNDREQKQTIHKSNVVLERSEPEEQTIETGNHCNTDSAELYITQL